MATTDVICICPQCKIRLIFANDVYSCPQCCQLYTKSEVKYFPIDKKDTDKYNIVESTIENEMSIEDVNVYLLDGAIKKTRTKEKIRELANDLTGKTKEKLDHYEKTRIMIDQFTKHLDKKIQEIKADGKYLSMLCSNRDLKYIFEFVSRCYGMSREIFINQFLTKPMQEYYMVEVMVAIDG